VQVQWVNGSAYVELDDVERGRPEGAVLLIHDSPAVRKAVTLRLHSADATAAAAPSAVST
jgi:hypothetical protein